MMKSKYIQYYVEGEDEKKLLNELKTEMQYIRPGKVQIFNVIQNSLRNTHMRLLKKGTLVVLVFDTDVSNDSILKSNIEFLKRCTVVSDVICITQVGNLEDELVRSCKIHQIKDLLNSKSNSNYKSDLIIEHNLKKKLEEKDFNFSRFWAMTPTHGFTGIRNGAELIKIKRATPK